MCTPGISSKSAGIDNKNRPYEYSLWRFQRGGENLVLIHEWIILVHWDKLKMNCCCTTAALRDHLERQQWEEILYCAEFERCNSLSILYREKSGSMDFWMVANGLDKWSWSWKIYEIWFMEEVYGQTCRSMYKGWRSASYINVHQRTPLKRY